MKLDVRTILAVMSFSILLVSCSKEEDETVNRNPVKTTNKLAIEDVIYNHIWELYDYRLLNTKTYQDGKLITESSTYGDTLWGSYEFIEGTTTIKAKNLYVTYATVNEDPNIIFPDSSYHTTYEEKVSDSTFLYKILDDSTMIATAFSPAELTAFNVEKEFIQLEAEFNSLSTVGGTIRTTTSRLEIDLAPKGTKGGRK